MHSRRWHSIGIEVWWTYNYDDGENIGHELTISPPHSPIDDDCSWRCSSFLITHCNSCPWWCSEPSCGMKVKIFLMVLDLPCHIMALAYICFPAAAEEKVTGRNRHVYSLLTFEFFSTTITMIRSNDGSPICVLCGDIIHYLITTPSAVSFIDAGTGQLTRFRGESLTLLLLCILATLYPAHPESATFIYRYS